MCALILEVVVLQAEKLQPDGDVYCLIQYKKDETRTELKKRTSSPKWKETFQFDLHRPRKTALDSNLGNVHFGVYREVRRVGRIARDLIGSAEVPISTLHETEDHQVTAWFDILKDTKKTGRIQITMRAVLAPTQSTRHLATSSTNPCGCDIDEHGCHYIVEKKMQSQQSRLLGAKSSSWSSSSWNDAEENSRARCAVPLPKNWVWEGHWEVDPLYSKDAAGWKYGSSHKLHDKMKPLDNARRRRWIRERRYVGPEGECNKETPEQLVKPLKHGWVECCRTKRRGGVSKTKIIKKGFQKRKQTYVLIDDIYMYFFNEVPPSEHQLWNELVPTIYVLTEYKMDTERAVPDANYSCLSATRENEVLLFFFEHQTRRDEWFKIMKDPRTAQDEADKARTKQRSESVSTLNLDILAPSGPASDAAGDDIGVRGNGAPNGYETESSTTSRSVTASTLERSERKTNCTSTLSLEDFSDTSSHRSSSIRGSQYELRDQDRKPTFDVLFRFPFFTNPHECVVCGPDCDDLISISPLQIFHVARTQRVLLTNEYSVCRRHVTMDELINEQIPLAPHSSFSEEHLHHWWSSMEVAHDSLLIQNNDSAIGGGVGYSEEQELYKVIDKRGVAYRRTANLRDRIIPEVGVYYQDVVLAKRIMGDWIQVDADQWLPIRVDGERVLRRLENEIDESDADGRGWVQSPRQSVNDGGDDGTVSSQGEYEEDIKTSKKKKWGCDLSECCTKVEAEEKNKLMKHKESRSTVRTT